MFLIKIELKIVLQTRGEPYTFRNFFFCARVYIFGVIFFLRGFNFGVIICCS